MPSPGCPFDRRFHESLGRTEGTTLIGNGDEGRAIVSTGLESHEFGQFVAEGGVHSGKDTCSLSMVIPA